MLGEDFSEVALHFDKIQSEEFFREVGALRKLLLLLLALVAVLVFPKYFVVMVTDTAGLGDKSFNDSVWAGIQKAVKDFGIEARVIQSMEMADYVPNLEEAVKSGADLVVAVGFLIRDSVEQVAKKYPNAKFVMIDAVVDQPNVMSMVFREQEIGFVTGVLAALVSKTQKIGWVGGMFIPPVERFEVGYRAGAEFVNVNFGRHVKVLISYVGSFENVPKAKSLALQQFAQGADIVFAGGGKNTLGIFEAAKEYSMRYEKKDGIRRFAIGVDQDQDWLQPGYILTSAMKRVDVAVYSAIKDLVEGKWKGGIHSLGLAGNYLSLSPMKYTRQFVPKETLEIVNKVASMIKDGKLYVPVPLPKTRDELKKFNAPKVEF